ncbi:MAG: tetratricopeptide repeat protein [Deltaproteobacteria bacterium]|nr:tetratricopeptide repeat protein [Deltaproteobacteria bacterium]
MEEYGRSALEIEESLGNKTGMAACLNNIATSLAYRGRHREALDQLDRALALHREIDEPYGRSYTLGNLGFVHGLMGENRLALDHHLQALKLRRQQGDRRGEATTLDNIGAALFKLGDRGEARDFFNRSLAIRLEIGDRTGQATCLNNIGYVHSLLGDHRRTLECYQQALKIRRETGDQLGYALILQNAALLQAQFGEYGTAQVQTEQALEIRSRLGDRSGQAYSQVALARLLMETGDRKRALELLGAAADTAAAIEENEILFRVAVNLAELSLTGQDAGQAGEQVSKAVELSRKLGSKPGLIQTVLLQARIDSALGKCEEAEAGFLEAMARYQELKQPFEEAKVCCHFSEALRAWGRREEAGEYSDRARRAFTEVGAKGWLSRMGAGEPSGKTDKKLKKQ